MAKTSKSNCVCDHCKLIDTTKEQLQEDVLCLLEGIGIEEALDPKDWEALKTEVCEIIITNLNKLK